MRPLEADDDVDHHRNVPGTHVLYRSKDIISNKQKAQDEYKTSKNDIHEQLDSEVGGEKPHCKGKYKFDCRTEEECEIVCGETKTEGIDKWIEIIPLITHDRFLHIAGRGIINGKLKSSEAVKKVIRQIFTWFDYVDNHFNRINRKTRVVVIGLVIWDRDNPVPTSREACNMWVHQV